VKCQKDTYFWFMRKLMLLSLLFLNVFLFAQDTETEIQIRFNKYTKFIEERNLDSLCNYLDSSFVSAFPKEQLQKLLAYVDDNSKFKVITRLEPIDSFGNVYNVKDKSYCIVSYLSTFTFLLNKELPKAEKERIKDVIMEGETGSSYDKKKSKVVISKRSQLIAIKKDGVWYFFLYRKEMKPYLTHFFSKEVISVLEF
jgi:hypothetical protein